MRRKKNMGRDKTRERIVVEEMLKHNPKARVGIICRKLFGYDNRTVNDIAYRMRKDQ